MRRRIAWVAFCCLLVAPTAFCRRRAVVPPTAGIGEVKRVFIVVLENEDAEVALLQPMMASLAARGALLSNYFAITHNSQPNSMRRPQNILSTRTLTASLL